MNCLCRVGSRPRSFRRELQQCPWLWITPGRFPVCFVPGTRQNRSKIFDRCSSGNTWSGVCHRDDNLVTLADGQKLGSCHPGRELDRITDQVGNDLSYATSIDWNRGRLTVSRLRVSAAWLQPASMRSITGMSTYQACPPISKPKKSHSEFWQSREDRRSSIHLIGRTLNLAGEFLTPVHIDLFKGAKYVGHEFHRRHGIFQIVRNNREHILPDLNGPLHLTEQARVLDRERRPMASSSASRTSRNPYRRGPDEHIKVMTPMSFP